MSYKAAAVIIVVVIIIIVIIIIVIIIIMPSHASALLLPRSEWPLWQSQQREVTVMPSNSHTLGSSGSPPSLGTRTLPAPCAETSQWAPAPPWPPARPPNIGDISSCHLPCPLRVCHLPPPERQPRQGTSSSLASVSDINYWW